MKATTDFPSKDNSHSVTKVITPFALLLIGLALPSTMAQATVNGPCSNCHTMHNSQNGSPLVQTGTGANLLTNDCVGCHSSSTTDTIDSNGTPIVWNTVAPTKPLAGGNFYWVSQAGDANDVFGHNVWGIKGNDSKLSTAPGNSFGSCGTTSCHDSLATDPALTAVIGGKSRNGCQGCHTEVAHHDDSKPWFRFLKGHWNTDAYVEGIETPTWEQDATTNPADRNVYRGTDASYGWAGGLQVEHTASAFCQGCHTDFHQQMGGASPWIRHPNDILLPETSEYAAYDPTTNYSNEAPVAYLNTAAPTRAEAVVTCLSCHRAHGSDQPDMLRWDYTNMGAGTGCYTCHTSKD
jgi:predicted CXXCH cytochrome family protein